MKRGIARAVVRTVVRILLVIVLTIIVLPLLLYIPAVQDLAKGIACREVSKATGMELAVERLRLRFPLRVELDGVALIERPGTADADTMLSAAELGVDVAVLPLLRLQVDATSVDGRDLTYRMGTPDSLMYLRARVDRARFDGADIDLKHNIIDIDNAAVRGARINLDMRPDSVAIAADTATTGAPWLIKARRIELDSVDYAMRMMPTIDTLKAHVGKAVLADGTVDMASQTIHARYMSVDGVEATYLYPSPTVAAQYPVPPASADSIASAPWTVTADSLRLTGRYGRYGMAGARPQPGFDMEYISVTDIEIAVDSFYNRGVEIRVPIRHLSATERCGVALEAHGTFAMDSTAMRADGISIASAQGTSLRLTHAMMGVGDLATDPSLPLQLLAQARVAPADLRMAFPATRPMLAQVRGDVELSADVEGTPAQLNIYGLNLSAFNIMKLHAQGMVDNVMDFDRLRGSMSLRGSLNNPSPIIKVLPKGLLPEWLAVPSLALDGSVDYAPGAITGQIEGTTEGGRIALDGRWVARAESYDAALDLDEFPVNAFMPSLGVGRVTASLNAHGKGYNPLNPATTVDADLIVDRIVYQGEAIENVSLRALAGNGTAQARLVSEAPDADLEVDVDATIGTDNIEGTLSALVRHLDLQSLKLMADTCAGAFSLTATGSYNRADGSIDAEADISDLHWLMTGLNIAVPHADATLQTTPESLNANLASGDLDLRVAAREGLDSILAHVSRVPAVIDTIMARRRFDVEALQHAIPDMELALEMGQNNPVAPILAARGMGLQRASLDVRNDSLLTLGATLRGLHSGTTAIDSIDISAYQRGKVLTYTALMNNAPGTMDNFAHVKLSGFMADNRLSTFLTQSNIEGAEGFNLGVLVTTTDSTMTARMVPANPVIAYRRFTLNPNNYLSYGLYNHHLHADLALSDGNTDLRIYTTDAEGDSVHSDTPEDLIVHIANLQLADYLTISPFAPPIKGEASADVRLHYDGKLLTGSGKMGLVDFYYDRRRVGTFDADFDMGTDPTTGMLRARMDMDVDSVRTLSINGVLNDTVADTPVRLNVEMTRFPLKAANPFIPQDVASVSGTLNGSMHLTGRSLTNSEINGYLNFDTAAVKVKMLGTSLLLSNERIPVNANKVNFDDFTITGTNDNPLYVNGQVDIADLTNVGVNLNLYASDMQLVNTQRPRGADVYGKGNFDINADVRGDMRLMRANATVSLLPGSALTYVLDASTSSNLALQGQGDMVKFVQFSDSAAVAMADSVSTAPMMMVLNATLNIAEGTTLGVDLSTTNNDRVEIKGNGTLNYTMSPLNTGRLTGRFNINGGLAKYTPPAIVSEKTFHFIDGSYVAFNGDMLNPTLNIHAYDEMKANVTREGENSRLVNFDVKVNITGTLETMNVGFDLSTNDDITVSNELASMSPDQRANQAMNLLLYGVYNSNGTNGNANIGGNILYTFVESTVNNWMANNIKGVDISFGIDQYDKTYNGVKSTATNYSYHVSKTLFNDRFKIVVGGSYSTDTEGTEQDVAENLFNDISAEYMLNATGTMYVRIFRHTGYESILEGEVTQTGVGFVYRRRIDRLSDMFRPFRRLTDLAKPKTPAQNDTLTTQTSAD